MDIPVFKEYFQNLAADDRYLMVSYLGACITRKGHSLKKLVTLTTNNTKEKEKMMESIAQEYIDKGIEQGMERGRQEEKLGIARTMYRSGEPLERVARWTGLSEASIRSL